MVQRPKIVLAACATHNLLDNQNIARMQQAADREDPTTHEVQPEVWRAQNQVNPLHQTQRQLGNTEQQLRRELKSI